MLRLQRLGKRNRPVQTIPRPRDFELDLGLDLKLDLGLDFSLGLGALRAT